MARLSKNDLADVTVSESCLGVGTFGAVYLGFDGASGRQLAVKEIPLQQSVPDASSEFPEEVRNEIGIMLHATHPKLVKYYGARLGLSVRTGVPVVQIFMEYVPGGSLASLINRVGRLREGVAAKYACDVVQGIAYLHDRAGVCHRDVKPDNVLLTADGVCKVTDFGASKAIHERGNATSALLTTCVGSPPFMAPEVARGDAYGRSADIWGIGCLVVHLLTGAAPTFGLPPNANPMALLYRIASDDSAVPSLPSTFSEAARSFVAACGQRDPALRPKASELLSHPWLLVAAQDAADGDGDGDATTVPPPKPRRASLTVAKGDPQPQNFLENDDAQKRREAKLRIRRCDLCETGIALFSCDLCRRQGLASSVCASCWDRMHPVAQATAHRKGPLLIPAAAEDDEEVDSDADGFGDEDDGYMLPSGAFVDTAAMSKLNLSRRV